MRPEDFFKTIDENESTRKEGVLNRYMEKVINKHFGDCINRRQLKDIMFDSSIKQGDKQYAVREMSEGILKCIYFFNDKTDIHTLIKKGKNHEIVNKLIEVMQAYECDVLVFPVYKIGDWVAHSRGMSPDAVKMPRIIIPGDGISVTMQDIGTFVKEYK
jgi:hypothetical protein